MKPSANPRRLLPELAAVATAPTVDDSDTTETCSKRAHTTFLKAQRRIPALKKAAEIALRVPPHLRYAFIFFWFCWKIALTIALIFFFHSSSSPTAVSTNNGVLLPNNGNMNNHPPSTRILYIITTLAEFNNGKRATTRGQDRLGEVLIPVMMDSINSMTNAGYDVDVCLILGYELREERELHIRSRLPPGVGLHVWDDALPSGYEKDKTKIVSNTRALARQHRYVIKDYLEHYDLFVVFEDDMRISGQHVSHFLEMSHELNLRRQILASASGMDVPETFDDAQQMKYFGDMTEEQMERLIPGFIRVEVVLNHTVASAQTEVDPVPLDHKFNHKEVHVDPSVCCHVNMEPNINTPTTPVVDDVIIWETNVRAFSLRQLPVLPPTSSTKAQMFTTNSSKYDWMVVMLGPGKNIDKSKKMIGGYWSGREGAFGDFPRPSGGPPTLIAQQGGWMATRDQIIRMNSGLCMGSFLPPFDNPIYKEDGQQSMNVEFWSGSYQIFTGVRGGCNMQRLISMHPDHFSNHLLYHVANNKQRQLSQDRMVRVDHLYGQLNTVRKQAIKAKENVIKSKQED